MHQLQDLWIGAVVSLIEVHINEAVVSLSSGAMMQTTAARPGMFTKDKFDEMSQLWLDENPLRVRDVKFCVKTLRVEAAAGEHESTSHMQLNWRRIKRRYFEIYLFRSALTANDRLAMRRVCQLGV